MVTVHSQHRSFRALWMYMCSKWTLRPIRPAAAHMLYLVGKIRNVVILPVDSDSFTLPVTSQAVQQKLEVILVYYGVNHIAEVSFYLYDLNFFFFFNGKKIVAITA